MAAGDPANLFIEYFKDSSDGDPLGGLAASLSGNIEKDLDALKLGENDESIAFLSIAYLACGVPGSTVQKGYERSSDIRITVKYPKDYEPETATKTVGDVREDDILRGVDHKNGEMPTYKPSKKSDDDFGDYGIGNINKCPDIEAAALFKKVTGNDGVWKRWFIQLLAAHQTKPLTKGHVRSYFAKQRSSDVEGEVFAKMFPGISAGLQNVTSQEFIKEMAEDDKWMEYRMTFAASTVLLGKMIKELPENYLKVFSQSTIDAINASNIDKHDSTLYRKIPEKALAVLVAYLKVTDQLPDDLWGPMRAYGDLTFQEKESLKNYFTEAKSKIVIYQGSGIILSDKLQPSILDI
jgi:hypothetical protein